MSYDNFNLDELINQRYQIIEKIGAGGMAQVYSARDLFLHRIVALKVINPVSMIDDLIKERFYQEIKAVARVRHPNVVLVYDVFYDQKNWCLVFELVKGETLKRYFEKRGKLNINEIINVFEQVIKGVNACHQAGIIHRDIKPENVLMADSGAIKVADFGISVIDGYEVKKHEHQVVGTMKYIAPELVKFQSPTIASDIYALGIMLYELLVGKPPFFHKNIQILASKHLKEPMPYLRDLLPEMPQALENIIIKATMKDPNERYGSVKEMDHDLKNCLGASRDSEKRIKQRLGENGVKPLRQEIKLAFYSKKLFIIITLLVLSIIITILALIITQVI